MTKRIPFAIALTLVLGACKTTPDAERVEEEMELPPEFRPQAATSSLQHLEGPYPNLYSPESYAIWVTSDVARLKRERDAANDIMVEAPIDEAAAEINARFIVMECHIESVFPDASIAYDAVGFRGVEVYLQTPSGQRIDPVQTIVGGVQEEQREALRLYRRTNLVVFPKTDVWGGERLIDPAVGKLTLVLQGQGTAFYFDWENMPYDPGFQWKPTAQETLRVTRLGFREVYGRLLRLSHVFD